MFTVTFRADASTQIGTGHVMRCLALADAFAREGASCRFITREHAGHLNETIRGRGHLAIGLPAGAGELLPEAAHVPAHAQWLGVSWQEDAEQTIAALSHDRTDWLVVDHYALDARWETALRPHCGGLMALDDLADRPHRCTVLLDANLGRTEAHYAALVQRDCTVLAGTAYALLRPEFAALRPGSLQRRRPAQLRQLLVALGGVDQANVTARVLEALASCDLPATCRIEVVMGAQAPWIEEVRAAAQRLPWETALHVGVGNMAQIMSESDLAIGAAGTMAWERCCLGLPTLTVVLADNQRPGAAALAAAGAALALELPVTATALRDAVAGLTPRALERIQEAAAAVADGKGVQRVLANLRGHHACV